MASDEDIDAMDEAKLKAELKRLRKKRVEKIVVKTEKKLSKKFDGERVSKFSDWHRSAKAAMHGKDEDDKLEMVLNGLEGKALREILRHPEDKRNLASQILKILEEKYADRRSSAQIRRQFYSIVQSSYSVIEFSDLLVECLEGTEEKLAVNADGLEQMLVEQFVENVSESMLSWELKRAVKNGVNAFDELRKLALEFEAGQKTQSRGRSTRAEEQVATSDIAKLTQAVNGLTTKVDNLTSRVQSVENRLNPNNNNNNNGGYRGHRGGWRPRGSNSNWRGGRGGYNNWPQQGQQQQQQQPANLNPNANDFVPPQPNQEQGNGQAPRGQQPG